MRPCHAKTQEKVHIHDMGMLVTKQVLDEQIQDLSQLPWKWRTQDKCTQPGLELAWHPKPSAASQQPPAVLGGRMTNVHSQDLICASQQPPAFLVSAPHYLVVSSSGAMLASEAMLLELAAPSCSLQPLQPLPRACPCHGCPCHGWRKH